jgi:hypothetical protein
VEIKNGKSVNFEVKSGVRTVSLRAFLTLSSNFDIKFLARKKHYLVITPSLTGFNLKQP